jgi:hypothetical protein
MIQQVMKLKSVAEKNAKKLNLPHLNFLESSVNPRNVHLPNFSLKPTFKKWMQLKFEGILYSM